MKAIGELRLAAKVQEFIWLRDKHDFIQKREISQIVNGTDTSDQVDGHPSLSVGKSALESPGVEYSTRNMTSPKQDSDPLDMAAYECVVGPAMSHDSLKHTVLNP